MRIDSHQHFWNYNSEKHAWINEEMLILRQDYLPEQLQKTYEKHQIDGCIAVQADQSEAESSFLLDLAEQNDFIKGVVGWADLRSPKIQERLEYFSHYKKMKGFRHVVQGEADHNFILRPVFQRGIRLLENYNFTYDLLIYPHQLGASLEFVRLFPNLKIVIDHMAKPYIKDGFFDGWANQMHAIARYENVYCKVSGIVTEADWANWEADHFKAYLDVVVEAFGMRRLLFGSDWPVCLLAASYEQMLGLVEDYFHSFSSNEKEYFFGGNAVAFYQL